MITTWWEGSIRSCISLARTQVHISSGPGWQIHLANCLAEVSFGPTCAWYLGKWDHQGEKCWNFLKPVRIAGTSWQVKAHYNWSMYQSLLLATKRSLHKVLVGKVEGSWCWSMCKPDISHIRYLTFLIPPFNDPARSKRGWVPGRILMAPSRHWPQRNFLLGFCDGDNPWIFKVKQHEQRPRSSSSPWYHHHHHHHHHHLLLLLLLLAQNQFSQTKPHFRFFVGCFPCTFWTFRSTKAGFFWGGTATQWSRCWKPSFAMSFYRDRISEAFQKAKGLDWWRWNMWLSVTKEEGND